MTKVKGILAAQMILERENGDIFLMRRFQTGFQDGRFGLPAGHVDPGEDFLNCAVREASEEAGVLVEKQDAEVVHIIHKVSVDDKKENRVEVFFKTKKWSGEPRIMEPHKCDEAIWCSPENLPENMVNYVGKCLKLINDEVLYSERIKRR